MFDRRSRYHGLEELYYEEPGQPTIVYKSRRFVSRVEGRPVLWEVEVKDTDRPDLLAARTLQQPDLFWRLCDANDVMHPFELTRKSFFPSRSKRKIRVLMPGA